jgi:hypothetical protein
MLVIWYLLMLKPWSSYYWQCRIDSKRVRKTFAQHREYSGSIVHDVNKGVHVELTSQLCSVKHALWLLCFHLKCAGCVRDQGQLLLP